eukprot:5814245-Amphidinium_carterae.1
MLGKANGSEPCRVDVSCQWMSIVRSHLGPSRVKLSQTLAERIKVDAIQFARSRTGKSAWWVLFT